MELARDGCTGCRACELACGFRRTGVFTPAQSSLHVAAAGEGRFAVVALDPTCDLCRDLPAPECVRYCAPQVLTRERLASALGAGKDQP
jgi:carbon-monoxide dehydrogenase iron sulfur subunit